MWMAYFPLAFVYFYYVLCTRRFFFFSNVNPTIDTAGAFGESKMTILKMLPKELIPETLFVENGTSFEQVLVKIAASNLEYPIIAKPDVGERGNGVQKLKNEMALQNYMRAMKGAFIIQEFLVYPVEVAILHYRYPDQAKGHIPSLCVKEYLNITGDGTSSVELLMSKKARANLQIERLKKLKPELLAKIPAVGEKVELEPIGNHSRGTMFLNANAQIDEALIEVFDQISHQLDGIYYGRYDIKCESMAQLKKGQDFKVMELNGVAGEAAHIYDPSYPIWKKYRDVIACWQALYEISEILAKKGIRSMSWLEFRTQFRAYKRKVSSL